MKTRHCNTGVLQFGQEKDFEVKNGNIIKSDLDKPIQ